MQTAKWRGVVVAGVMMALVGAPMVAGVAFAAGNKHQAEAVEHAKEAVAHGKQGHADALVKQSRGSRTGSSTARPATPMWRPKPLRTLFPICRKVCNRFLRVDGV